VFWTQTRNNKTPAQKEVSDEFERLGKKYNELIYGNQPDPGESVKEFFRCVGILSLIVTVVGVFGVFIVVGIYLTFY